MVMKKSIDGLSTRAPSKSLGSKSSHSQNSKRKSPSISKKLTTSSPRRELDAKTKLSLEKAKKQRQKQAKRDFLEPVQTFDFNSEEVEQEIKKMPKNKKEKKKKKWIKWVVIGIFLALLVAAGIFIHNFISKITNGNSGLFDAIGALVDDGDPLKVGSDGRTNILVFGTSGYDMSGSEGNGVHDGAQLTDSIMVISLDQDTKDIAMVSIPRDMKAKAACAAGKINEVYWCNNKNNDNEEAGASALQATVEQILGLEIQYHVHLNWQALVQVVDAIGGITVTLDENVNDNWTKTYIKAGVPATLNGEQALGLARARHGTANGDFTRGENQQKILVALEQKILEKGLGVSEAISTISALGDNLRMNVTTGELKTAAKLLSDFDIANMRQIPLVDPSNGVNLLTTGSIGGVSYVLPSAGTYNYTEIDAYLDKMLSSDPAVREDAKIEVLNGSTTSGVAATEKEKLEKANLTVSTIGDAPTKTYEGYTLYIINPDMTGTKSKLEKMYKITAKSSDEIPAGIRTNGYDFILIVGATSDTKN